MIRERCSCGAEFETDDPHSVKLLQTWRRTHRHEHTPGTRDSDLTSNTETATQTDTPRTTIGFTTEPWEE